MYNTDQGGLLVRETDTQRVQEIYKGTVLSLSREERLQLASLILSGLTAAERGDQLSAVALLKSFPGNRGFRNSEDVDAYLCEERESWER